LKATLTSLVWFVLCAAPLNASECLAPKPMPVAAVCGQVRDPMGNAIADVELQLLNSQKVAVVDVHTDSKGVFTFSAVPAGEYNITASPKGYSPLYWPLRVTRSKAVKACKQPLSVTMGVSTCGDSVERKGYHGKWYRRGEPLASTSSMR
jgi:Carboxypeptidase regulatory-like domain